MDAKRMAMALLAFGAAMVAWAGAVNLAVDFGTVTGSVKPVNGVNQPPILGLKDYSMFHYLKEARIPFSRTHDVGGKFGGFVYVDVENVFPDLDEDENDPANYRFKHTDLLFRALFANGVEPFFRLGATIENCITHGAAPVRVKPPKDYAKYARVCSKIVAHYNEGWANGHRMDIRHWEIWNEPDLDNGDFRRNQCWNGPFDEFLKFYAEVSTTLKRDHPNVLVGGAGLTGFYSVNDMCGDPEGWAHMYERGGRFVAYCAERELPLDFLSFHSYARPYAARPAIHYVRALLDAYGFTKTKIANTEWNYVDWQVLRNATGATGGKPVYTVGHDGEKHLAYNTAMLVMMQQSPVDMAHFYDARVREGDYTGLFDPATLKPRRTYYGFRYFGELAALGREVKTTVEFVKGIGDKDPSGVWAMAAVDAAGKAGAILVVSQSCKAHKLNLALPAGWCVTETRVTDATRRDEPASLPATIEPWTVLLLRASDRGTVDARNACAGKGEVER